MKKRMLIIGAALLVTCMALLGTGCATSQPLESFGRYGVNVGENGTNAFKAIIFLDDGSLRWE